MPASDKPEPKQESSQQSSPPASAPAPAASPSPAPEKSKKKSKLDKASDAVSKLTNAMGDKGKKPEEKKDEDKKKDPMVKLADELVSTATDLQGTFAPLREAAADYVKEKGSQFLNAAKEKGGELLNKAKGAVNAIGEHLEKNLFSNQQASPSAKSEPAEMEMQTFSPKSATPEADAQTTVSPEASAPAPSLEGAGSGVEMSAAPNSKQDFQAEVAQSADTTNLASEAEQPGAPAPEIDAETAEQGIKLAAGAG